MGRGPRRDEDLGRNPQILRHRRSDQRPHFAPVDHPAMICINRVKRRGQNHFVLQVLLWWARRIALYFRTHTDRLENGTNLI